MKKQLGLMLVTTCSAAMLVAPQAMAEDTAQLTEARCVALVDAVKDATAKQRDAQDRERATQQTLYEGLVCSATNGWPSVESDLMGNMGKINLLCTDTASHTDGIIDELMAMVRLVETQGIDN